MAELNEREELAIEHAIARLRALVLAVVFGMAGGTGLFLATAWLVLRGGPNVGAHLGLLRFYLPFYTVTWPGAFLGFVYGALAGVVLGFVLASLYNRVAEWRNGRV